jgi:predicted permease
MGGWMMDGRVGARALLRRPGFALMVVLTLAVGIGANTALFGVFKTVFLQPIPLPEPSELTFVMQTGGFGCCGPASGPDYLDWRERQRSFSEIATINHFLATLTGPEGDAERLQSVRVTASTFDLLGVDAARGRLLTEEDQVDPSVIVLSHWLWESHFGAGEDILGQTVTVNGRPMTVVGVMPEGFDVLSPWMRTGRFALYAPFSNERLEENRGMHGYPVVARLAEGVSLEAAEADMQRIMRELEEEYPQTNEGRSALVFPAHEYLYGDVGKTLGFILGAAGLVLLIACGNVAGLQLARVAARETELTVRAALGGSRAAVSRLLFTESLLLAIGGGVTGIVLALGAVAGLKAILPQTIPRIAEIGVDGWAFLFAAAATLFTAFAFGVTPAVIASKRDLAATLREGGYATVAPRKERFRDYFIVGQIALGLVLANGAGLLLKSYRTLRGEETGFEAEGMLTLQTVAAGPDYGTTEARTAYFERLIERASNEPGVVHAGVVSKLPLRGGSNSNVLVEGQTRASENEGPLVEGSFVAGEYFAAAGIGLLAGRTLTSEDTIPDRIGVVINQQMATSVWPGEDPLGKRFSMEDNPPVWLTVVGVVEDVKQWGLESNVQNEAYQYISRSWTDEGYLTLRTAGDAAQLAPAARRLVLEIDPALPPSDLQTMSARVEEAFAQRRFTTTLIALFTLAALGLGAAGIYGTVSYYVARRTRELGIRMALGAGGTGIVVLVLRRGVRLAVWGVGLGLLGAWASTAVVETLLYGTQPVDAVTMATGALVLGGIAVAASVLPAARAVRVPPVLALRSE